MRSGNIKPESISDTYAVYFHGAGILSSLVEEVGVDGAHGDEGRLLSWLGVEIGRETLIHCPGLTTSAEVPASRR